MASYICFVYLSRVNKVYNGNHDSYSLNEPNQVDHNDTPAEQSNAPTEAKFV